MTVTLHHQVLHTRKQNKLWHNVHVATWPQAHTQKKELFSTKNENRLLLLLYREEMSEKWHLIRTLDSDQPW